MDKTTVSGSIFIMSLDVESLWGSIMHPQSRERILLDRDRKKGRGDIDILLSLCAKHNIPATWAMIGHLFLDKCRREKGVPHYGMPRHRDNWYSCDPCSDIESAPLYYGKDIVEKILGSRVRHEIGYHSFSHVPFSECTREVAEAEIEAGLKAAADLGIKLESFVFPYNKIGHVDVLREKGFKIYRGVDPAAAGRSSPLSGLFRELNRFSPTLSEIKWMNGIWEISGTNLIVDMPRYMPLVSIAKAGINRAVRAGRIFHIWLHPHNLILRPSLSRSLDSIMEFVSEKRNRGELRVMTMGDLVNVLHN